MTVTFTTGPATLKWAATTDSDACKAVVMCTRCLCVAIYMSNLMRVGLTMVRLQANIRRDSSSNDDASYLEVQVRKDD